MGPKGDGGFTLLELLVVIVILALIGSLVLTRGPAHSQRLNIEAAVRQVAEGLRLARTEAIVRNHRVNFRLDTAGHAYDIDGMRPAALPASIGLSIVGLAEGTSGGQMGAISFAPDGSSSGGRIDLSAPGRHRQIRVDWLTGRVSVSEAP